MNNKKTFIYMATDRVFGAGYTREQAILDAAEWLEDSNGIQGISYDEAEEMLNEHDCEMIVINAECPKKLIENDNAEEIWSWYDNQTA